MPRANLPECVACGSCCLSAQQDYLELFAIDLQRMDATAHGLTRSDGARQFMRIESGRCAALCVDFTTRELRCTIYPMRPDVCRWLERGSGACLEQVDAKGDQARQLLTRKPG